MSRLTAFLDWIDEAAGALIRLAYLAAGITAVAVYFGAGHLPPAVENALNGGLPWALAFAVETHTYITSRRVRAAWQDLQASTKGSDARERARGALWVNLAVLAVLLAFSAWNQLGYLADTWTPPATGILALPSWLAYVVRALVVPGAFMAAAFLAPLAEPITAQLESEARATLADVFKIARKQRRRLLREAEASGRDMTGALVELVPDPDARRIIAHAYGAIRGDRSIIAASGPSDGVPATIPVEPHPQLEAPPAPSQPQAEPVPELPPESVPGKPPTGPGSPAASKRRASKRKKPARKRPAVLKLIPEGEATAETRIRALLDAEPGLSIRQLAERAAVSTATASKWAKVVRAEQRERGQVAR